MEYESSEFAGLHKYFMRMALMEAEIAGEAGDIPVGAVIVRDGIVISKAHNERERNSNPCGHAEILAIQSAAYQLQDWRLAGCSLYVTLEPCMMCMGAIIQSRIKALYYGCGDPVMGAYRSAISVEAYGALINGIQVYDGILSKEASSLIKEFFSRKRNKKII